jgi:hypothetical protein
VISITFDTDHMTQESLSRFLGEYVSKMPGCGTFFAHSNFPELLATKHETCPHPFISDLNRWDDDLSRLEEFLPTKPRGTRPHSCVFSHMVGIGLKERGYSYVSQAQNLYATNLVPFRHPWGIWELPIYYMDNMDFWMCKNWPDFSHEPFGQDIIENAVQGDGLYVFDIHPLHVALNTRSHEDYVAVKDLIVTKGQSPFDHAYEGNGTRNFFERLCARMREKGLRSYTCSEVLEAYGCE